MIVTDSEEPTQLIQPGGQVDGTHPPHLCTVGRNTTPWKPEANSLAGGLGALPSER